MSAEPVDPLLDAEEESSGATDDDGRRRLRREERMRLRLALGADAPLSIEDAAELLPGSPASWRRWIRENVPLRPRPTGGVWVRLGDIFEATDPRREPEGRQARRAVRLSGVRPAKLGD